MIASSSYNETACRRRHRRGDMRQIGLNGGLLCDTPLPQECCRPRRCDALESSYTPVTAYRLAAIFKSWRGLLFKLLLVLFEINVQ